MKKKQTIAVITGLFLVCALALAGCQLAVDEPVWDIALTDPYISKQPASYSFFVGEALPDPLTLSIEVAEWVAADGVLTYQWYTFNTFDEYVTGQAAPIDGATGTSYTPGAALKTTAGSENYYYAVVTNTNTSVNVGDKVSGSIQSEVAVISFTAASDALPPIISRHPGNAGFQAGRAVNALAVRAATRPDRTAVGGNPVLLSYQWYTKTLVRNDAGDITGIVDEPIPNAAGASYQPDPSSLRFGKNYFFVEVITTEGLGASAKTGKQTSAPAFIEILPGARAIAPTITVQPKDKMYFIGDTVAKLSVEGVSRDNGDISYQWYLNEGAVINPATATPVGGATEEEYTPNMGTTAAVTRYYYAVITNTQLNVTTDQTTAAVTSKLAKVSVAASGTETFNATVTVENPKDPTKRYQYVRGYGGMDVAWANFPEQLPEDMELMFNPDRLGYNINRIMISPGNVDPAAEVDRLVAAHRPNYYENVKIVNKYGGYNLASPWSPPKEWKSNNSINGGGHLIKAYYKQFAEYLRVFAQNMYDHGAPIYAISISNEPNYTAGYDGCEWTPAEMRDFYKEVGRFTSGIRGYGGGKQIPTVLTVNGESANTPDINVAALLDPVSRSAIDLLCRHVYGSQTTTLWRYGPNGAALAATEPWTTNTVNILDRGDTTKYEVWMTEHNINSANATAYPSDSTWNYVWRFMNDVDLVMRINNENAFVWWASKRFYSMIGDNSYGTGPGNALPRGYGLSHYAKYTNDTHRIVAAVSGTLADGATPITFEAAGTNVNNRTFSLDNPSARITAYASITSGKDNAPINDAADDVEFISLVMWTPTATSGSDGVDMGIIKIDMPAGFKIGSYTAIRSTGAGVLAHVAADVTIDPSRESAYVTLPRSQMLSVKFIKE